MNTDSASSPDQSPQTSLPQPPEALPGQAHAHAPVPRSDPPNRGTLRIVARSVAATLLVLGAAAGLWRLYDDCVRRADCSQGARRTLGRSGSRGIVRHPGARSDRGRFDSATLDLPAGEYRLRVNGNGRLGALIASLSTAARRRPTPYLSTRGGCSAKSRGSRRFGRKKHASRRYPWRG